MGYGTNSPIIIKDADEITISGRGDEVPADVCDGIRNGTGSAGNVNVKLNSGRDHIFKNIPSGGKIFARIEKIYETNTSLATVERLFIE